jgi:hypothetical protein
MTYEEAVELLDGLDFLSSYDINYGREYHFSSEGTFAIRILKTFLTEGYAVCYCISHYNGYFDFEHFYESMPQKMQERIIFNINVFNKINGSQCSGEDRDSIISWAEIMAEEYSLRD